MRYDLVVLLFTDRCFSNMRQISSLFGIHIDKWFLLEICLKAKDVVCILTWYIESYLSMVYQSFTNNLPILISCYIANHLPIFFQLITNDLAMQFLYY